MKIGLKFTHDPGKLPFKGPKPYSVQDAELFRTAFARPELEARILDCIIANGCTILYGPSGAGKTSILNAVLIPYFRGRSIEPVIKNQWQDLPDSAEELFTALPDDSGSLLILDQLELLLSPAPDPERAQMLLQEICARIADPTSPRYVILGVREDCLGLLLDVIRNVNIKTQLARVQPLRLSEMLAMARRLRPEWAGDLSLEQQLSEVCIGPNGRSAHDPEIHAALAQIICVQRDENAKCLHPTYSAKKIIKDYIQEVADKVLGFSFYLFVVSEFIDRGGGRTFRTEEELHANIANKDGNIEHALNALIGAGLLSSYPNEDGSKTLFALSHDAVAHAVKEAYEEIKETQLRQEVVENAVQRVGSVVESGVQKLTDNAKSFQAKSYDVLKSRYDESTKAHAEERARFARERAEERAQLAQERDWIKDLAAVQIAAAHAKFAELDTSRKTEHESKLATVRAEHIAAEQALAERHQRELRALEARHQQALAQAEDAAEDEVARLQQFSAGQLSDVRAESMRLIKERQELHDAEAKQAAAERQAAELVLRERHRGEVAQLEEAHRQQLIAQLEQAERTLRTQAADAADVLSKAVSVHRKEAADAAATNERDQNTFLARVAQLHRQRKRFTKLARRISLRPLGKYRITGGSLTVLLLIGAVGAARIVMRQRQNIAQIEQARKDLQQDLGSAQSNLDSAKKRSREHLLIAAAESQLAARNPNEAASLLLEVEEPNALTLWRELAEKLITQGRIFAAQLPGQSISHMRFSADGTSLALVTGEEEGKPQIYTLSASGAGQPVHGSFAVATLEAGWYRVLPVDEAPLLSEGKLVGQLAHESELFQKKKWQGVAETILRELRGCGPRQLAYLEARGPHAAALLVASDKGLLRVPLNRRATWPAPTNGCPAQLYQLDTENPPYARVTRSPDSRFVVGQSLKKLVVFDLNKGIGQPGQKRTLHTQPGLDAYAVAWGSSPGQAALASSNEVQVWDLAASLPSADPKGAEAPPPPATIRPILERFATACPSAKRRTEVLGEPLAEAEQHTAACLKRLYLPPPKR